MEDQNQDSVCTCEQSACQSAQKRFSIWGTLALILGISSMFLGPGLIILFLKGNVFSIFDYIHYIGYTLSILGLICSIVSIVRKETIQGLAMAIAGIVCSVFGFFEAFLCHQLFNIFYVFADFLDGLSNIG